MRKTKTLARIAIFLKAHTEPEDARDRNTIRQVMLLCLSKKLLAIYLTVNNLPGITSNDLVQMQGGDLYEASGALGVLHDYGLLEREQITHHDPRGIEYRYSSAIEDESHIHDWMDEPLDFKHLETIPMKLHITSVREMEARLLGDDGWE